MTPGNVAVASIQEFKHVLLVWLLRAKNGLDTVNIAFNGIHVADILVCGSGEPGAQSRILPDIIQMLSKLRHVARGTAGRLTHERSILPCRSLLNQSREYSAASLPARRAAGLRSSRPE